MPICMKCRRPNAVQFHHPSCEAAAEDLLDQAAPYLAKAEEYGAEYDAQNGPNDSSGSPRPSRTRYVDRLGSQAKAASVIPHPGKPKGWLRDFFNWLVP